MCQSACAKCHRWILDRHRHLFVVETHRIVPLPFRSDQRFWRHSRKGQIIWHHLARVTWHGATRDPQRILSQGNLRVTCQFEISGLHRLTCRAVRKLLQAFTRRHVPCAMCHQSTHGRHHRRSGVLARRMVPRRARSDQPFGRYSRKCLDTHTDWLTDRQTRPANYFSPTHQRKSSFIERSMLKHLNVHSLRFWIILAPKLVAFGE